MIKVEAKSAIIALAIMSIFNEEFDYLYQNICVILNFKWYNTIEERSENKTSALPVNVLYPNPTAQMINLTWEEDGVAKMIITDLQGKLVMTSTIDKGTNSIDLSTLDSGLYIYQIVVETTVQQNGKIVLLK